MKSTDLLWQNTMFWLETLCPSIHVDISHLNIAAVGSTSDSYTELVPVYCYINPLRFHLPYKDVFNFKQLI